MVEPLTEIECMAVFRLSFSERSLLSMRNHVAGTQEERWENCRRAIASGRAES